MTINDVQGLTVEEQAGLTSGLDFWHTKPIERLGLPSIMLTDGPNGLRKQPEGGDHLGLSSSVPATCFPPAAGIASSWDTDLMARVGAAVGLEAAVENVAVLLGPGINIKRSPLCGRNFEYFSEDPILSGVMGAAFVDGVQSQGVGTSLKHFAANNQETDRMRSSSDIDERPLREIYLRGFQRVVQDAQPWTVMCSYNRINGVFASEDPWLLTKVLRDEWGFQGLVVSDWGAVNDRVKALRAGLDLEMPSSNGRTDAELVQALQDGTLDEGHLATAAGRVVALVNKVHGGSAASGAEFDVDAHHALAREAATRSIVLLKNDGGLLPLRTAGKIAVVGAFAERPRYQGAGSALVNPTRLDSALEAIREQADGEVIYAPGFSLAADASADETSSLLAEAVAAATHADVVVLFLGLPARLESEGYDRDDIDLPAEQLALVDAVTAANPNVVVVLSNGGVVTLPFASTVPAILEAWLLGQAGGGATADVLFGRVNPSGKLAETIPVRLSDTPAYLSFPGERSHTRYGEGLFVGYRWFDARDLAVAFPFGHGLSYTTFEHGSSSATVSEHGDITISVRISNTGTVAGREVVQVYSSLAGSAVQRPRRELKAFASVALGAGEARVVELTVRRSDLAYWDTAAGSWIVEGGEYDLQVGASSRDIRSTLTAAVVGDPVVLPLDRQSTIGEVLAHPVAGPAVQSMLATLSESMGDAASVMPEGVSMDVLMASFPIGRITMIAGDAVTPEAIDELLAYANGSPR
ncbi:MAG TPA: glycoside hydrolase family 3 C-terminal domain-containing protein [Dermatophilaceae bacterium]|jgi:beta-glucosidase|nr:glycoside hydrolase family 3 C-terminal domain-containing protein [Dermatophilaceae bacterium]